jgi:hypothetical protein
MTIGPSSVRGWLCVLEWIDGQDGVGAASQLFFAEGVEAGDRGGVAMVPVPRSGDLF